MDRRYASTGNASSAGVPAATENTVGSDACRNRSRIAESLERAAAAATFPRHANGAPELSGAADTNVPRPTWPRTSPRVSRSRYALTTVVRLTLSAWASSRSAGRRKSRASVPVVMPRSIACAMWRYTGLVLGSRPPPRPSSVSCVSSHKRDLHDRREREALCNARVPRVRPERVEPRLRRQMHERGIAVVVGLRQHREGGVRVADARPPDRAMVGRDVAVCRERIELLQDADRPRAVALSAQ